MKTNILLTFIVTLGIILILGAAALWHLSSTTEFTRADSSIAPVNPD